MTKLRPIIVVSGILTASVLVGVGMFVFIAPLLEGNDKPKTVACDRLGIEHQVTIQNNKVSPEHTQAKPCDVLVVTNKDAGNRLMAFGVHERHISYNGVSETKLRPNQQYKVTLNTTGTYLFHDHYDETVAANFTVSE